MRPRLRLLVALLAPVFLAVSGANAQISANFGGASGGSVIPGNDSNACSSTNNGAIRYTGSQFQVCYGSGGWAALPDASGTVAGLSSDRITSGTAGVFVSNTGIINLRTGGVTTGYFDGSGLLVIPGISITTANGISSTNGYFSAGAGITLSNTIAIGTGTTIYNGYMRLGAPGNTSGTIFLNDMSNVQYGISAGTTGLVFSTNASAGYSYRFYGTSSNVSMAVNTSVLPSTTLHVSGTALTTSWTGINFSNYGKVVPTAPLEVSGTVSATRFIGDGSGLTGLTGDRITSGTAGVFVSNTGVINFRTGGVTTGYFDASGLLVAPGISITTANGISSTNGYFSGALITAPRDNASTSINWAQGNVQRTSSSCGAFTFTNMQDGGAYTLTIEGTTAGTCSFSHSGLTFRMPPDHGAVSTGTMTLYTFLRSGTNVFVNWTPGY